MGWGWAALLGVVVGVVLGALGGGGAILTVPLLVYVLGLAPHDATASSLVIVGSSSLVAMTVHARVGNVRIQQGLIFGALGLVGNLVGVQVSKLISGRVLLGLFAVLILVVALTMIRLLLRVPATLTARLEASLFVDGRPHWRTVVSLTGVATVVGLLTGLLGVGGGFMIVPALTLVLGFDMRLAVGTSLLIIAFNSAAALVTRVIGGATFDWPVVLSFTAASITGSLVGARVSRLVSPRRLSAAFATLLVVVALYTIVQVWRG
ncbi:MAG TPA: sulfite exporter TauE/SafE family protein [Propionibacteriaceae bacterium]|nr:sulfite exporter TauE/SafE family protein [Propionibacteriaceae bacterium]